MKVVIIQYNAGNILSVKNALLRLNIEARLTNDPEEIQKADKVIFPGVGEASTTMAYLKDRQLDQLIPSLRQPVLGICLGMQLLCQHSEEGDTSCLGIFPNQVKRFRRVAEDIKIPHIGWNRIERTDNSWLPETVDREYVYFVHSYFAENNEYTATSSQHGQTFASALQKDNFYGTQFHPEKSGKVGASILKAFLNL